MASYYVLGIEGKEAEVWGIHSSKKKAQGQATWMEQNKPESCCQRYAIKTKTEIKRRKLELYA